MFDLCTNVRYDGEMNRRERALSVATELVVARQRVADLEAEFERLVPDGPIEAKDAASFVRDVGSIVAKAGGFRKSPFGVSLPEKILGILASAPDTVFNAEELHSLLDEPKMSTLRTTLARLSNARRIERPKAGSYRAVREAASQTSQA